MQQAYLTVTKVRLRQPVALCVMGKIRHLTEEKNMTDSTVEAGDHRIFLQQKTFVGGL